MASETASALTLEERFSAALHNGARTWRLLLDRRLKDLGMSQASWMTIAVAAKAGEPLAQTELARRVGVEDATMVTMVDRLVKAELVVREPSTTDRRVKLVVVTKAGVKLYEKVRREADAMRRELFAGIDPARLRGATELLEQLLTVMEQAA
ncbi:MAG: MarR family transcriptional regulator [Proteobacteria bacterium]|nr:MarR family transcriptional regulator [Pseudomonadota bacterium]